MLFYVSVYLCMSVPVYVCMFVCLCKSVYVSVYMLVGVYYFM